MAKGQFATEHYASCGQPADVVADHETKLNTILEQQGTQSSQNTEILNLLNKMVEESKFITYMNGDDGETPTTVPKEKFFTAVWKRTNNAIDKEDFVDKMLEVEGRMSTIEEKTSAKHVFSSVSSFSDKIYKIAQLVLLLVTLWYAFNANKKEAELEQKVKSEQITNK